MTAIELHLTPGAPLFGVWCDICAAPSAVRVDIYVLSAEGPRCVDTMKFCVDEDHDERDISVN